MLGILFASVQKVFKDRISAIWKVEYGDLVSPPWYSAWLLCFVCELLAKHNMTITRHTRDSPDLAPCDFFLSAKTEDSLKGKEIEWHHHDSNSQWTHLASFRHCSSQTDWGARLLGSLCEVPTGQCFDGEIYLARNYFFTVYILSVT